MLRLAGKHPILEHVAAFTVASVVASCLFLYVLRPITISQPEPGYHIDTLGKGDTAVRNLIYLSDAIRGGKTLVVLGSSELEQKFWNPYTPNIFFPEHHLAKVYTYGRAGFETLGMYGLMYGIRPHLNPKTRLVIMLSPEWFRSTDLRVSIFSENFNDNVLLQLYWSDEARSVFHDYLTAHQFEFSNMTPTQTMYLSDPISMYDDLNLPGFLGRTVNARAFAQREKLELRLEELTQRQAAESYSAGNAYYLPWDRYEDGARAYELERMTHNPLWVRDSFYKFHSGDTGGLRPRHYYPDDMNPEPEMAALRELLQLLHTTKVKALFIMQPINPKLFDDVHSFDPIDARVAGLCNEFGMRYYDMYQQPYQRGVLRDAVHPGQLGWEQMDLQIAEYFRL